MPKVATADEHILTYLGPGAQRKQYSPSVTRIANAGQNMTPNSAG